MLLYCPTLVQNEHQRQETSWFSLIRSNESGCLAFTRLTVKHFNDLLTVELRACKSNSVTAVTQRHSLSNACTIHGNVRFPWEMTASVMGWGAALWLLYNSFVSTMMPAAMYGLIHPSGEKKSVATTKKYVQYASRGIPDIFHWCRFCHAGYSDV